MNSDTILMLALGIPLVLLVWTLTAALIYVVYLMWRDK